MNNEIKIGDEVTVFLTNGGTFDGVVAYMPQSAGESWIITDLNKICYVQTFSRIVKYG